ncbi:MAG: DinB family protein [Bacteroidetes bacterium]|nr:DinB family protein [Bacteroidota bacterium]
MKEACKRNLDELSDLISKLSNVEYSKSCKTLFGASIGQHTRHIIELFLELFKGIEYNEICYDNRARNILFETEVQTSLNEINLIKANIDSLQDESIKLKACFSTNEISTLLQTTIFRELAYNLEHCIHHQALIKVGLSELKKLYLIEEDFGVAFSTIKFKRKNLTNTKN